MAFRVPDFLRYEMRHRLEQFQDRVRQLDLRRRINDSPGLIVGMTCLSALLLAVVLVWVLRPTSGPRFQLSKTAWFYDENTGRLFPAGRKQAGPIPAPSGATPEGQPAGFRAHVYSYVLDPTESQLFVGFLERPDPGADRESRASDIDDLEAWARGRLIKRVKDKQWVPAASPEGQAILQELTRPNKLGQTPIYQLPGER